MIGLLRKDVYVLNMTKLYLVRHGETILNQMEKMQGWIDSPLTKAGLDDAIRVGKKLADVKFDSVYTSDMMRTICTAEEIIRQSKVNKEIDITSNAKYREIYFGSFEGESREESWKKIGKFYGLESKIEILQHIGFKRMLDLVKKTDSLHIAEDGDEIQQRISQGLSIFENVKERNILLVTHGMLIHAIAAKFGGKDIIDRGMPNNGSITVLNFSSNGWKIESYNQ